MNRFLTTPKVTPVIFFFRFFFLVILLGPAAFGQLIRRFMMVLCKQLNRK